MRRHTTRREVLGGLSVAAPALAAGAGLYANWPEVKGPLLGSGERLSYRAHRLLARDTLAPEFGSDQISPRFPTNGSIAPDTPDYPVHAQTGFRDWRLKVDGLVANPQALSLAALKAMPARSQITRHDCVEGWSAIAQWTGTPLRAVLDLAGPLSEARYLVFWCADIIRGWQYYESIDMVDAYHPQTILAYGMNGGALPTGHGAPVRLRVERQLGYKHAKFVMRIEAVAALGGIGEGKGGFWEDAANYEWYAGI